MGDWKQVTTNHQVFVLGLALSPLKLSLNLCSFLKLKNDNKHTFLNVDFSVKNIIPCKILTYY